MVRVGLAAPEPFAYAMLFSPSMGAVPTLANLLADIEERLFTETPTAVRRGAKGWPSPPWCCALVFDGSLPPLSASRLLVRVAKRLNALPSKSFGVVADEFVVYAFDRNEPATKLVVSSLTPRKLAALERLRLL